MSGVGLSQLASANAAEIRARFLSEVARTGIWTQEETDRLLLEESRQIGPAPPIAFTLGFDGLNTVLEHGRLFTLWDVAAGRVRILPLLPQPSPSPITHTQEKLARRRRAEDLLRAELGKYGDPVYASLSSTEGVDRASGGWYGSRLSAPFLEFDLGHADLFLWGDSFDTAGSGGDEAFRRSRLLDREAAMSIKPCLDLIRRNNFPIVGIQDFGPSHPRYDHLLCLDPRVTSAYMEALCFEPPPLDRMLGVGIPRFAVEGAGARRLEALLARHPWLERRLTIHDAPAY